VQQAVAQLEAARKTIDKELKSQLQVQTKKELTA
jgi:hypothetical protein